MKEQEMTDNTEQKIDPVAEEIAPSTDETAALRAEIDTLNTKLADSKDQLLRAMAEVENVRRRTQKEKEDMAKFAVSKFALEMLNVADNFRRALEAVPADTAANDTLKNLIAGVEATERQLLSSFDKFGIKAMAPMNQVFDPHSHRVMLEIEDPSKPAGTVVQVLQAGYMIHDRLLREALVAVSKGGPAAHKVDAQV